MEILKHCKSLNESVKAYKNSHFRSPFVAACFATAIALFFGDLTQGSLVTGDIAIIGFASDSDNEFSWVSLVGLETSEKIYFTDNGYSASAADFMNTTKTSAEWLMQYIVPAGGVAAGTVQTVIDGSEGANYTFIAPTGWGNATGASSISLNSDFGDQLYAFQSSELTSSATFGIDNSTGLFGLTASTTNWSASTSTVSQNETNLYPDLTDGVNAIAAGAGTGATSEFDNFRYTGTRTGTREQLLAAISKLENWEQTNSDPAGGWTNSTRGDFVVVPEPSIGVLSVTLLTVLGFTSRNRKCRC